MDTDPGPIRSRGRELWTGPIPLIRCPGYDVSSLFLLGTLEEELEGTQLSGRSHHVQEGEPTFPPGEVDLPTWEANIGTLSLTPVSDCILRHLLRAGWSVDRVTDFVEVLKEWGNVEVSHFTYSTATRERDEEGANPIVVTIGGPSKETRLRWTRWWFEGQEDAARTIIQLWGKPTLAVCPPTSPNWPVPIHKPDPWDVVRDPGSGRLLGYALYLVYTRSWWYPMGKAPTSHCSWCGSSLTPGGKLLPVELLRESVPRTLELVSVDNDSLIQAARAVVSRGPWGAAEHLIPEGASQSPLPPMGQGAPAMHWVAPTPFKPDRYPRGYYKSRRKVCEAHTYIEFCF